MGFRFHIPLPGPFSYSASLTGRLAPFEFSREPAFGFKGADQDEPPGGGH